MSQFNAEIKRRWPELTENEVMEIQGDRARLSTILQRRFGYDKVRADREVDDLFTTFSTGAMAEVWTGESLRAGIPGRRYEAVTVEPSEQDILRLKEDIRANWDLSEREIERSCQDPDLLEEVLRDKYGYSQDRAREEVAACYDRTGFELEEEQSLRAGVAGRRYEAVRVEGTESDFQRVKDEIRSHWDLSEAELEETCRDPDLLEEVLRTKYGYSKSNAREEVARCYDRAGFMATTDDAMMENETVE